MIRKTIETRWHRLGRLAPFYFNGNAYLTADEAGQAAQAHHEATGENVVVTDRDNAPVWSITTETFEDPCSCHARGLSPKHHDYTCKVRQMS